MRRRSPPDSGATGVVEPLREAAHLDAAEQTVENPAERGVARPFVVRAAADQLVAHRPLRGEVVALAEERRRDAARAGHRAGVGVLDAGEQPQQRRLALAVAPDDPDAVALGEPERHVAQHRARAVALVDRVEVDEVARRGGHALDATRSGPAGRRVVSIP